MAIDNLSISPTVILPVLGNPEIGDRVGLGVALATVLASRLAEAGQERQHGTV
jgi:hypothetical protein